MKTDNTYAELFDVGADKVTEIKKVIRLDERDWRARDQLWGMSDRVSVGILTELHNGFQRK